MVPDLEDLAEDFIEVWSELQDGFSMLAECFMTASSPSKKYYGLRTRDTDTGTLFSRSSSGKGGR